MRYYFAFAIGLLAFVGVSFAAPVKDRSTSCPRLSYLQLATSPLSGQTISQLMILTDRGVFKFKVEEAMSTQQKSQGLMYRRDIQSDQGMLFYYQRPRKLAMWMKNTHLALDMIFIDKDAKVSNIYPNAKPLSEQVIYSQGEAQAVLELLGESAKHIGLKVGDTICHRLFN